MIIERFVVGPVMTNCYLVICSSTREAAIIDPGGEAELIIERANALSAQVKWIVNTHGHADHIAANTALKGTFPEAKLALHEDDEPCLDEPRRNLSIAFGEPLRSPPADILLKDGDEIAIGDLSFRVMHVPGHTPGGIALYAENCDEECPLVFCGDTLFEGSVGRTDFPGGSHSQLIEAIQTRLLTLPQETRVYPGHGEPTTIGREAKTNPFVMR